ncbi:uncharacterized protein LOC111018291 isoform X2 [Momordica charantia]|uniref:Uncharacterized protein LOC111018291 isoform X2 n=1 Tax=Momordica charantia TaxID=3673 RepID=A0A6J1D9J7_MOMCH|nr:uncharacterized protein LOC111018291 isoform X2 [Momordica charantia]
MLAKFRKFKFRRKWVKTNPSFFSRRPPFLPFLSHSPPQASRQAFSRLRHSPPQPAARLRRRRIQSLLSAAASSCSSYLPLPRVSPPLDFDMRLYYGAKEILKIQKFRRIVSYTGFYLFVSVLSYAYTSNTTRAGYSRGDQFYASYPAGTELLTDTAKLYKAALGNCFESEEWGPIEFCIMAKHFERQGKSPYAYHAQYMAHLLSHGQLDGSG